jgi:hypothetical protein
MGTPLYTRHADQSKKEAVQRVPPKTKRKRIIIRMYFQPHPKPPYTVFWRFLKASAVLATNERSKVSFIKNTDSPG